MNPIAIFWPVVAQVLLVFLVYFLLSKRRFAAVRSGTFKAGEFRERKSEPAESTTTYNNLVNQFELPVLLYVVCISLFVTNGVSYVTVLLAWIFVISRYAHAFVHVTINRLRYRRPLFVVGFFALGLLWVWFALHLLGVV